MIGTISACISCHKDCRLLAKPRNASRLGGVGEARTLAPVPTCCQPKMLRFCQRKSRNRQRKSRKVIAIKPQPCEAGQTAPPLFPADLGDFVPENPKKCSAGIRHLFPGTARTFGKRLDEGALGP